MYAQAAIAVGTADAAVQLTLNEGAKLSGKLVFDGSAPQPQPQLLQQQFTVTLTPLGRTLGPLAPPARVGQDGLFATTGNPSGRYYITPTARGAGAWALRSISAAGRDVLNDPLELRDADITDVVITYTDKIGQITATVHGSSGAQAPPSTLILFPADYRGWIARGMNPRLLRNLAVPGNGSLMLGNVSAGDYLVAALDDADVPDNQDAAFFDTLARVATRVSLQEGDRPSVELSVVKVRR
jgi:hypothetical protein